MNSTVIHNNTAVDQNIATEMLTFLKTKMLDKWYPLVVDKDCGGYFTNISCDWKLEPTPPRPGEAGQEKMIVSQARHIWATSKFSSFLNEEKFKEIAQHGYRFLKEFMWDERYGGFYQMRSREGNFSDYCGYGEEKRTYGNAFGIYSLAALYKSTNNEEVLDFAKKAFEWIEEHAFDSKQKGYFQFLTREGEPFDKESRYKTKATDGVEVGYKDQNSSIHLLEAYTELYSVLQNSKLQEKLFALLKLIRDTITTPMGFMNLFFEYDWTPVSFRNANEEIRKANYRLDHISFGHNYETAFLMLEASYVLGLEKDLKTLQTAKSMVDHAIENGWDEINGGFFDGGYYFKEEKKCTIIQPTKTWWAQAEGLNILLLFSKIFPDEPKYYSTFLKLWDYVKNYLLDYENGDWFEGGIDKEPHFKTGPKSHIWKCTYHTGRALMNCIKMFSDEDFELFKKNQNFRDLKHHSDLFINHWNKTAKEL